jgi:hypothetical protein
LSREGLLQNVTYGPANEIQQFSWAYRAAGNVNQMPGLGGTLGIGYDGESRVTVVNGPGVSENYAYRPDGKRVWRRQANGVEEVYFYGLEGEKLWQLTRAQDGSLSWRLYYYFAGKMVARSGEEAVVTDRLGSVGLRAVYGQAAERRQYYPYGEEGTTTAQGREK